jgi:general secretion pathway protein J
MRRVRERRKAETIIRGNSYGIFQVPKDLGMEDRVVISPCKGFTLLELLISLSIVGLILVIVFGSLRIGARAWEKGEKDLEANQRQRIVLELVRRQIVSLSVREMKDEQLKRYFLRGDSRSMEFISRVALLPTNRAGMVHVRYLIEKDRDGRGQRFLFYEKGIILAEKGIDEKDLRKDQFVELVTGIRAMSFEYLKGGSGEELPQWEDEWDPEKEKGFPIAVKIIFREKRETDPVSVIARIQSYDGRIWRR